MNTTDATGATGEQTAIEADSSGGFDEKAIQDYLFGGIRRFSLAELMRLRDLDLSQRVRAIRSLDQIKRLYENQLFMVRIRGGFDACRDMIAALSEICREVKGTPAWAEATTYLGLCWEGAGHPSWAVPYFRDALAADQPPADDIQSRLLYRIAVYDLAKTWRYREVMRLEPDEDAPGVLESRAQAQLASLAARDTSGLRTQSEQDLGGAVRLLLEASKAPSSLAATRARLELAADLCAWQNNNMLQGELQRDALSYIQGDGSEAYRQYLQDPAVPAADKSVFENRLMDACVWSRAYQAGIDHARQAAQFAPPDRPDLAAHATMWLAKCYWEAGDAIAARSAAAGLFQSPGYATLNAKERMELEWLLRYAR